MTYRLVCVGPGWKPKLLVLSRKGSYTIRNNKMRKFLKIICFIDLDAFSRITECLCLFIVTCRPEPEVTWYCNGEPVEASARFKLDHSKGVYHLSITSVEMSDAGQWRCVAVNPYGENSCSCELRVIGKENAGDHWEYCLFHEKSCILITWKIC